MFFLFVHMLFLVFFIDVYKLLYRLLLVLYCFFLNSELPSPFPNFEFRVVSRSVFTELERRDPGENLTRGSPFQFREHGL